MLKEYMRLLKIELYLFDVKMEELLKELTSLNSKMLRPSYLASEGGDAFVF